VKKNLPIHGQRLTVGLDLYNLLNNNVTLGFNQTFVATAPGATPASSWPGTTSYMNPRVFRLSAEYSW
jgi:outer membrane receptor protein involved in Fe transport